MTTTRRFSPYIGLHLYGVAAIALGIVGLVWGDFATNWQRVQPDVPYREAFAYFTAAYELVLGLATLWRRTARSAALLLTLLYAVFALLWVIQIFAVPGVYDSWGNFFEELSLVMGGAVAFALLAPPDSPWAGRTAIFIPLVRCLRHLFWPRALYLLRQCGELGPQVGSARTKVLDCRNRDLLFHGCRCNPVRRPGGTRFPAACPHDCVLRNSGVGTQAHDVSA